MHEETLNKVALVAAGNQMGDVRKAVAELAKHGVPGEQAEAYDLSKLELPAVAADLAGVADHGPSKSAALPKEKEDRVYDIRMHPDGPVFKAIMAPATAPIAQAKYVRDHNQQVFKIDGGQGHRLYGCLVSYEGVAYIRLYEDRIPRNRKNIAKAVQGWDYEAK